MSAIFRFPASARYAQESCSALLRRAFVASSGSGAGDGSDKTDDGITKQSQRQTEGEPTEETPWKSRMEMRKERSIAAKSKLAGLISSLSVNKARSPPPEQLPHIPVKLSRPPARGRKAKAKLSTEEQELREEYKEAGPEMSRAVISVATEVGGGIATQSELLQSIKRWQNKVPEDADPTAGNLRGVLSGLAVDKERRGRARGGDRPTRRYGSLPDRGDDSQSIQSISLFGGQPLNIFPLPGDASKQEQKTEAETLPVLATWDRLAAKDLELCTARPPANHYQELILWTNQGKIWQFPIDNEIGMDEEKSVGFQEHIFLETRIASWCPKTGPISQFMEMVCIGLSKNPHLTAERKRRALDWYKEFFGERQQLLVEVGALPGAKPTETSEVTT